MVIAWRGGRPPGIYTISHMNLWVTTERTSSCALIIYIIIYEGKVCRNVRAHGFIYPNFLCVALFKIYLYAKCENCILFYTRSPRLLSFIYKGKVILAKPWLLWFWHWTNRNASCNPQWSKTENVPSYLMSDREKMSLFLFSVFASIWF